jgi:hypothetical protein
MAFECFGSHASAEADAQRDDGRMAAGANVMKRVIELLRAAKVIRVNGYAPSSLSFRPAAFV